MSKNAVAPLTNKRIAVMRELFRMTGSEDCIAAEILTEYVKLKEIIESTFWMARRYADGRCTTAPSTVNASVRTLLDMGVELRPDGLSGTLFARDGMGRRFDGLTEEEAGSGEYENRHPSRDDLEETVTALLALGAQRRQSEALSQSPSLRRIMAYLMELAGMRGPKDERSGEDRLARANDKTLLLSDVEAVAALLDIKIEGVNE